MFKESIALENILEIFVAGGLFVIGTWYLHRPFLLEYFPAIAHDVFASDQAPQLGGKLMVFIMLAMLAGVFITHMFDAVVPLVIGDRTYITKRFSIPKKIVVLLFRIVLFTEEPDPRVVAVKRYLKSSRKQWFLAMVKDWCKSDEKNLAQEKEMIMVRQQVVARLRALSDNSREVLQDSYNQVSFAGSIFAAFLLLIPVSLVAFYSETLVTKFKTPSDLQLAFIICVIYLAAVISGFSLRRRLRNFYSGVITIGLHFHDELKKS
jgi:hypothetical protein